MSGSNCGYSFMSKSSGRQTDVSAELASLRARIRELESSHAEREEVERGLRESEERFRWVAERNFDLIYETDRDGHITFLSSAGERLAAGEPEKVLGRLFQSYLPQSELEKGNAAHREAMRGRSVHGMQMEVYGYDGSVRSFEFNLSPIFKDGQVEGVRGVCKDITELKRAQAKEREIEALREIDRLRTELLANVSHELRTPLATIKGYVTMLLNYDAKLRSDAKRQYLKSIDGAADQLMVLIDQLLDMSRLEAGHFKIKRSRTDVAQLVREVAAESRVRAPGHRIVVELPRALPQASIDARAVRRVLDNLIDNAAKYSMLGTRITLAAHEEGRALILSVSDRGKGISPDQVEKVFERMYRIEREADDERVSGLGLGLPICRGLVEAHGGQIWIESELGKGTTCYFTLPIRPRSVRKKSSNT